MVDRVLSYQVGAEVDTIRAELRRAANEIGVEVSDQWVEEMTQEIITADRAQE